MRAVLVARFHRHHPDAGLKVSDRLARQLRHSLTYSLARHSQPSFCFEEDLLLCLLGTRLAEQEEKLGALVFSPHAAGREKKESSLLMPERTEQKKRGPTRQ